MQKHRKALIAVASLVVLALAVVIAFPSGNREPQYQGRSLTEWLTVCDTPQIVHATPAQVQAAEQAVRHIGTNALPFYLNWILYQPRPWQNSLYRLFYRLPSPLRASSLLSLTYDHTQLARARRAERGFALLGPQASPAIPELTRLLNTHSSLDVSGRAAIALASTGRDGFAPLFQVLTNAAHPNRRETVLPISSMGSLGLDLSPAVPAIIQLTRGSDASVAMAAVEALGRLRLNSESSIPALTNALAIWSQNVRLEAVRSIRQFGTNARPAVPALIDALSDPYWAVQIEATNALRELAPEALTNAAAN